jgi:3-mercaptopyruvate sulfurtransferase SseA
MSIRVKYLAIGVMAILVALVAGCTARTAAAPAAPQKVGTYTVATTDEVKTALAGHSAVVVDARITDAFNGWKLDGAARGGHIDGAEDFSAVWLTIKGEDAKAQAAIDKQLAAAYEVKGLKDAKAAIVYDANGKDAVAVADYLKANGVADVKVYDVKKWAADSALPMKSYPNYSLVVPASYVKEQADAAAADVKIFECGWGKETPEFKKAHIPGAVHIDTDEVEVGPVWNRVSDDKLQKFAENNGITTKTHVILYGADSMPAYRVAAIMKYMGVEDVRVLNGGFAAWTRAGFATQQGSNPKVPVAAFGSTVPQTAYIVDMPQAKAILADPTGSSLVDIRSWDEVIGKTPGYSDIKEAGRPTGSRWGGDDPADFRNVDGTMRNFDENIKRWAEWGIKPDQKLAFFCGTGWRAAEVTVYADVAGLKNIALYDGGWYEWIMRGNNPKSKGVPSKVATVTP